MNLRSTSLFVAAVLLLACGRYDQSCASSLVDPQDCYLPVTPASQDIMVVRVTPANAMVSIGQSVQLAASVTVNAASTTAAIRWASSDSSKAIVDSTGLVVGRAVSTAVAVCATASLAGVSPAVNCASVTVTP